MHICSISPICITIYQRVTYYKGIVCPRMTIDYHIVSTNTYVYVWFFIGNSEQHYLLINLISVCKIDVISTYVPERRCSS